MTPIFPSLADKASGLVSSRPPSARLPCGYRRPRNPRFSVCSAIFWIRWSR